MGTDYGIDQSLRQRVRLLAATAAVTDVALFSLNGPHWPAPETLLLAVMIGCAGLALGLPPRFAGLVWMACAFIQVVGAWASQHTPVKPPVATSAFLVAGYLTGAWLPQRQALATLAVVICENVLKDVVFGDVHAGGARAWTLWILGVTAWSGLPLLVGRYTTARSAYVAEIGHRADRQRLSLEQAIADERAAIARDLHDVISHHVSATGMQAGAGRRELDNGQILNAKKSFEAIEHSSRAAASDLHRQLDILHGKDIDGRRQPSIANLDQVFESVRNAGLDVDVDISNEIGTLEQSLDIVVYRIVQELMTNALKYGTGKAHLTIIIAEATLQITQTNPLPVHNMQHQLSTGRGLTGIQQRVSIFDGTFQYGQDHATSTWKAAATIPIEQA